MRAFFVFLFLLLPFGHSLEKKWSFRDYSCQEELVLKGSIAVSSDNKSFFYVSPCGMANVIDVQNGKRKKNTRLFTLDFKPDDLLQTAYHRDVIIVSHNSNIYVLDSNLDILWSKEFNAHIISHDINPFDHIAIHTADDIFYVFSLYEGNLIWQKIFGGDALFMWNKGVNSFFFSNNSLYITQSNGVVRSINPFSTSNYSLKWSFNTIIFSSNLIKNPLFLADSLNGVVVLSAEKELFVLSKDTGEKFLHYSIKDFEGGPFLLENMFCYYSNTVSLKCVSLVENNEVFNRNSFFFQGRGRVSWINKTTGEILTKDGYIVSILDKNFFLKEELSELIDDAVFSSDGQYVFIINERGLVSAFRF